VTSPIWDLKGRGGALGAGGVLLLFARRYGVGKPPSRGHLKKLDKKKNNRGGKEGKLDAIAGDGRSLRSFTLGGGGSFAVAKRGNVPLQSRSWFRGIIINEQKSGPGLVFRVQNNDGLEKHKSHSL